MVDNTFANWSTFKIPAHWGETFTTTIHHKPSASIEPANVTLPDGYTVIVTGAGKGIGEYIAKAYVEAKAQNIILVSRTSSDLERVKAELEALAAGQNRAVNVTIFAGDVSRPETYSSVADIVKTQYGGRLDCLVNNAGGGIMPKANQPLHEQDLEHFTNTTNVNYLAVYYGMMVLMPLLLRSPGKTLINIVSGSAHLVDLPPAPYNVAKMAATRMTEIIAATYAKEGVKAYAVHPGAVRTPGTLEQLPGALDFLTEDVRLCGAVCVWLSKEELAWASGRYIAAKWDMDEFKAREKEIVEGDKLKFRMVV